MSVYEKSDRDFISQKGDRPASPRKRNRVSATIFAVSQIFYQETRFLAVGFKAIALLFPEKRSLFFLIGAIALFFDWGDRSFFDWGDRSFFDWGDRSFSFIIEKGDRASYLFWHLGSLVYAFGSSEDLSVNMGYKIPTLCPLIVCVGASRIQKR